LERTGMSWRPKAKGNGTALKGSEGEDGYVGRIESEMTFLRPE
jgi:hypothetical protein